MKKSKLKQEETRLWFTWESQRRNQELADAFGAEYLKFDFSSQASLIRYSRSAVATIGAVVSKRPKLVFVQYPSVVLCALAILLKLIFRFTLVVDAHNGAIEASEETGFIGQLTRLIMKRSDLVIISNAGLKDKLANYSLGILPDRLPDISYVPFPKSFAKKPEILITLIASFAPDEPIEEVLKAHKSLSSSKEVSLYVTGKRSRAGELVRYENEQVKFVDYLSVEEFDGLIANSDLLIDLTTRDDCLVCGAYEALAVKVPIILSDTTILKETFGSAAIYSKNNAKALSEAMSLYLSDPELIRANLASGREKFQASWNKQFEEIEQQIEAL